MTISLRPRRSLRPLTPPSSPSSSSPTKSPAKAHHKRIPVAAGKSTIKRPVLDRRSVHPPLRFMDEFALYYLATPVPAAAAAAVAKKTTTKKGDDKMDATIASIVAAVVPALAPAPPARIPRARAAPAAAAFDDEPDGTSKQGVFHYPAKLLANSPDATVEIAFSFDTTGSMSGHVNTVKREISQIVTQLLTDVPSLRIGIIAHGDYCDERTYILKRLDLSNQTAAIDRFVQAVTMTSGGDGDECYELVLKEAQGFNWSATSTKALVVIGDAAPHKPNQYRKIDWREELQTLSKMGVRCYGVKCGLEQDFYETIASETGGKCVQLAQIQEISQLMLGLAYREAAHFFMETGATGDAVAAATAAHAAAGGAAPLLRAPGAASADVDTLTDAERRDYLAVHHAIHAHMDVVVLPSNSSRHNIAVGDYGCRFVKIGGITFISQNIEEDSRFARMAAEGKPITWMVKDGRWGLIMDNVVSAATPEITPVVPA